ncbi:MAG: hypothetical protein J7L53_05170 [Deltaproteobacteria bacterium]|nr:hypothetical protein [Deltaproteobacteria bacterium]
MKIITFFKTLLLVGILVLPCSQVLGMQKVFFVHSYDSKNVCGVPQQTGAVNMLEKLGYEEGKNIQYQTFYMDTKKTYTTPDQQKERGKIALAMIKKFDPDVVVVMDDNAVKYVMLPLVDNKYQVVFSGMNGQVEDYDKMKEFMETRERPGHNVTGVIEYMHFAESFRLMQRIIPTLKKVMFITDKTPTGNGITKALKMDMQRDPAFPVEVEIRRAESFGQYKDLIREANKRDDVQAIYPIAVGLSAPPPKNRVVAQEIFAWTLENSTKPDVAGTFFFCKFGLLGGATVDFPAMGEETGMKIARILRGEKAGDIPIEDCKRFAISVNLARAEQLGIQIPYNILGAADHIYKVMALYPEYTRARKGE